MFAYCNNNPIVFADSTGYALFPTSKVMSDCHGCGSAGYGSTSVSSPGLLVGARAVVVAAKEILTGIANISEAIAATQVVKHLTGPHSVYVLYDEQNDSVEYVGRTTCVPARKAAHKRNPFRGDFRFIEVASNIPYFAARGLEQTLMLYYHTLNTSDKKNNQINGIRLNNDFLKDYIWAAKDIMGYAWNQVSNEVLYWAGI